MIADRRQRPYGAHPIYWSSSRAVGPKDWIVKRVGEMAVTFKGKLPTRVLEEPSDHSKPYLLMDGLRGGTHFHTEETHLPSVNEKDSLVIADGSQSGFAVRGVAGILGSTLLGFRAREDADPSLLYHLLSSLFPYLNSATTGTAIPHLDQDLLIRLPLSVPREQGERAAIAQILDSVDTALKRMRVAVECARDLERSLLTNVFENLKADRRRLGEFSSEVRYGTSRASSIRNWGNPVLRIPNVIGDRLVLDDLAFVELPPSEVARLQLCNGDLLLVRTNGNPHYVGRSVVFNQPDQRTWLYASYLIRVRLNGDLFPEFANVFLGTEQGRRELLRRVTTSAGNHNINSRSIQLLVLPVPPKKETQERIVELAAKCRQNVDALIVKEAALADLKKALMQDLLTGGMRVRTTEKVAAA